MPDKAFKHDSVSRAPAGAQLAETYLSVRGLSRQLCQPLELEDFGLQAMASTSPAKWYLAHTTWFFETFVLKPFCPGYQVFHTGFEYLFNSYYNSVGDQFPRAKRGLLSRPTVAEVYRYRDHVDKAMLSLFDSAVFESTPGISERTQLGCHHEQQHQELFFTDLKYCWFQNPLFPAYCDQALANAQPVELIKWQFIQGGLHQIGHEAHGEFCFDNELPRHLQHVGDFRIADRLISNAEYADFIADDGYRRPDLWLADGWVELQERAQRGTPLSPLYWLQEGREWREYTLHGLVSLDPHRPVSHLSCYEADAYARWAGCRLPTEFEWEVSVALLASSDDGQQEDSGQFLKAGLYHPEFGAAGRAGDNIFGRLWQWTSSAYSPYPGFRANEGALGEYNGKFMANQLVLRGGSCVTSRAHYRPAYRNFFYPPDQWQFTGVRLVQDS